LPAFQQAHAPFARDRRLLPTHGLIGSIAVAFGCRNVALLRTRTRAAATNSVTRIAILKYYQDYAVKALPLALPTAARGRSCGAPASSAPLGSN
jgi:hypothetical protein